MGRISEQGAFQLYAQIHLDEARSSVCEYRQWSESIDTRC